MLIVEIEHAQFFVGVPAFVDIESMHKAHIHIQLRAFMFSMKRDHAAVDPHRLKIDGCRDFCVRSRFHKHEIAVDLRQFAKDSVQW